MKNELILIKIIFANILVFSSAEAFSETVEEDKDGHYHIGISVIIGGVGQYYFQNWKYSMATCLSVGLAKEVYDKVDYGGFSQGDLLLDGVGCTIGVMATSYLWPNDKENPNKIRFSITGNETSLQYNYFF